MLLVTGLATCRLLKLVHEPEAAAVPVVTEAQDRTPVCEGGMSVGVDAVSGTVNTCLKVTASWDCCLCYVHTALIWGACTLALP